MKFFLALLLTIGLFISPLQTTAAPISSAPPSQGMQGMNVGMQNNNEDIRDIRGPLASAERSVLALALLAAVLLLIILGCLYFFWKKRRLSRPSPVPVGLTALEELNSIRTMMTLDRTLLYMERVSGILRRYVEARFSIPCTRKTSIEFLQSLRASDTATGTPLQPFLTELQDCLDVCDKAKFSHRLPRHEEMVQVEQAIRIFIERTDSSPDSAGGR